ncbi:MAG: efflux RND transporter periplasmic adaptor subunit [Gammaproteobacteria bacterium]|jgi:HlyD family secretion protein|nr:efflux RND transporter periplasmic adaptor subunit [Gammaproteobacteria bacterium]
MKTSRKILLAVLALLLLATLVWALRPAPVEVEVEPARRGPLVETVEDEGRTHLRNTYVVSAPIGGYLHRVALEPGDAVAAGDTVFELEPPPAPALDARTRGQARETLAAARARLEAARAERANREADLALAQSELRRLGELHERSLVAESDMERAESAVARAESALAAARASVEAAGFEVENARAVLEIAEGERSGDSGRLLSVSAPVGGVVLSRDRCCEGVIQSGTPVLEIGRLDELEVRVDLLSMDAVRVASGTRVIIEGWGGDQPLKGRVRRVEPAGFTRVSALGVEEQRVPVLVEIISPREQWPALGAGYRVEATFIVWQGEDVLQVPGSALFRVDDRWHVFVVSDSRAALRAVSPGRRSGLRVQILEGLEAGENVVTHPGDRLADGARVSLP